VVFYLVRHGQSEWNLGRLVQGQTPHPALTDLGRRQAAAAAELLATDLAARGLTAGLVLSSDLRRAAETAGIIAARLGVAVETDARLREQAFGRLEGRPDSEFWELAATHDWTDPAAPFADGESRNAVLARVTGALADLDPKVITVVVSHANAIRVAVAHLSGDDAGDRPSTDFVNGGVVRVSGSHIEMVATR
jgi:probable phosphoglycerate mutase